MINHFVLASALLAASNGFGLSLASQTKSPFQLPKGAELLPFDSEQRTYMLLMQSLEQSETLQQQLDECLKKSREFRLRHQIS